MLKMIPNVGLKLHFIFEKKEKIVLKNHKYQKLLTLKH